MGLATPSCPVSRARPSWAKLEPFEPMIFHRSTTLWATLHSRFGAGQRSHPPVRVQPAGPRRHSCVGHGWEVGSVSTVTLSGCCTSPTLQVALTYFLCTARRLSPGDRHFLRPRFGSKITTDTQDNADDHQEVSRAFNSCRYMLSKMKVRDHYVLL